MAQTPAQKAAAAKKAAAEKAAAAKKEAAYIASFGKTTSPSSSGLYTYGERVNMTGGSTPYNPTMAATTMTSTGTPPTKTAEENADGNPDVAPDVTPDKPKEISDATRDAFAMLTDLFTSYGLGSLAGEIAGYMSSGLTASEALIKLKTNPSGAYAERFAGNFARQKKGLNVMSESAYIELEDSYASTLKAYGLGNMLSPDSKQNWKQFSEYIANDINAPEFKDRISAVQDRVVNADPAIKAMFKEFYPSLTDKDLVAYFLNPTETIGKLKEKVTSAEIGAAFLGQGLEYTQAQASDLARYGIDRAGALVGAQQIKEVLPTSQKLSNIYGEAGINYNQKAGESEFLKGNQDAAEQRRRLKSLERAQFKGDSGVNQNSLTRNTQGSF